MIEYINEFMNSPSFRILLLSFNSLLLEFYIYQDLFITDSLNPYPNIQHIQHTIQHITVQHLFTLNFTLHSTLSTPSS